MVFEDFYDEIISTLGGSLVDVELSENDIEMCFKKAKRRFKQHGHNNYRRSFYPLQVNKDTRVYNLPEDIHTVIKIIRPSHSFNLEDPFSMAAYNDLFAGLGANYQQADFLSYELTLGLVEKWQRYTAHDFQFNYNEFSHDIELFKLPPFNQTWFLECYLNLTDEEYMDVEWIIRWTAAEAKEMLGIAYRKFGSLAAPTGETNLSGSEMISEAKEEKRELMEEILNFTDGGIDYMQITMG